VNHLVTSAEGCTGRIISPSSVNVYAVPEADFTNVPEEASILNPVISFFDASINAREWTWDFGDHSEMAHSKNTEHIFSDTGYYSVKMIATSHTGCADTVRKTVLIKGEFAVYIPNAFTPNNDGTNDKFSALGMGISDYEMLIYNRWGEKIYETKSLSDGWNGIRMDRDEKCAADVYVYKIYVVDNMGRRHDYVGHVNLVR
jgi:gliding motility-associated-like protein